MVGFELFLDVVAICFVFLLVGRDKNAPMVEMVEAPQAEAEEKATVPDVDLPSIGELFQMSDEVGDRYLATSEIEEREAARAAIAEVFAEVQPQRVGGGARNRITALLARSQELRERELWVDAAIFTVATVAAERPAKRKE